MALFHNLRLLKRMKKPNYTEPMIAWGDTDEVDVERSRVTKYEPGQAGPSKLLLKPQKMEEVLPLRSAAQQLIVYMTVDRVADRAVR